MNLLLAIPFMLTPTIAGVQSEPLHAQAGSLQPQAFVAQKTQPLVETIRREDGPSHPPVGYQETGGQAGYTLPGNNCVVCVRNLTGRSQNGNAGTWKATHSVPHLGSILILRPGEQGAGPQGHVAVVVGIRGNTLEVAHCNWAGKTTFQDNGQYF